MVIDRNLVKLIRVSVKFGNLQTGTRRLVTPPRTNYVFPRVTTDTAEASRFNLPVYAVKE